jgi:hypothetical protein
VRARVLKKFNDFYLVAGFSRLRRRDRSKILPLLHRPGGPRPSDTGDSGNGDQQLAALNEH